MARCEVYIEDAEDGAVAVNYRFMGDAFDATSPAHITGNAVRQWLDSVMTAAPDANPDLERRLIVN